jgi:hypothetical protein
MQKLPRQDGLFLFSMPILNLILCEMRNVNWEWEDSVPLLIFYFIFQAQDQGCAVGLIIATITYYRLLCKSGESQALGIKINCCGTSFLSLLPHMINWVLTFAFLEIIVESGWVELDTKLLPFVLYFYIVHINVLTNLSWHKDIYDFDIPTVSRIKIKNTLGFFWNEKQ